METRQVFDTANIRLEALNERCLNTMNTAIGFEFIEIHENMLVGQMVVSEKNCQPMGLLNGGASMAAIEIAGSMAANLAIPRETSVAVGQNIQGSHFRPAKLGETIRVEAQPLHIGLRSQIWEVVLLNSRRKLVCKGSITMAIIPRPAL
jgi:1,4-dihydroxy-2-naphthoyl-CoA hydrolase